MCIIQIGTFIKLLETDFKNNFFLLFCIFIVLTHSYFHQNFHYFKF